MPRAHPPTAEGTALITGGRPALDGVRRGEESSSSVGRLARLPEGQPRQRPRLIRRSEPAAFPSTALRHLLMSRLGQGDLLVRNYRAGDYLGEPCRG